MPMQKLYYQFRPDCYFWILVIICRKFGIAFTGLMFRKNPGFQVPTALSPVPTALSPVPTALSQPQRLANVQDLVCSTRDNPKPPLEPSG